jgi:hypothetical protein
LTKKRQFLKWLCALTFGQPHPSPLRGESVKKLPRSPLTLPSPARGEGKYIEIQEEIPSPSMGEGQGGGEETVS